MFEKIALWFRRRKIRRQRKYYSYQAFSIYPVRWRGPLRMGRYGQKRAWRDEVRHKRKHSEADMRLDAFSPSDVWWGEGRA